MGKTQAGSRSQTDSTAKNVDFSSTIITMNKIDRAAPTNTYTGQLHHPVGHAAAVGQGDLLSEEHRHQPGQRAWTGAGDTTYDAGRKYNPTNRYYTYNYFKSPPYNTEPTGYWQRYGYQEKRPYVIAEANYFAEKLLGGDHELKLGFDLNYGRYIEEYMAPNQMFVHAYPWSRLLRLWQRPDESRHGQRLLVALPDLQRPLRRKPSRAPGHLPPGHRDLRPPDHEPRRALGRHAVAWEPVDLSRSGAVRQAAFRRLGQVDRRHHGRGRKAQMDRTFSPDWPAYDIIGNGKDIVKFMFANYGGSSKAGSGSAAD